MPRVTYSEAQIDEARAAVFRYGSLRKASLETGYSRDALARWTKSPGHAERYEKLCNQLRAQVEQELINDFTASVAQGVAVTGEALSAASTAIADSTATAPNRDDYEDLDEYKAAFAAWATLKSNAAKDAKAFSDTAKNSALVAGIGVDKSRLMQDKPTSINTHERRDLDDILKSLNTLVPGLIVDSTAEDITPTQTTTERALTPDTAGKRVRQLTA